MHFEVTSHNTDAYRQALAMREAILRAPLGLAFTEAEAEQDREQLQVVGLIDGRVRATAVLVPKDGAIKMQRVAVDEAYRGRGFGAEMTKFCEQVAREKGYATIYCHARGTAVPFYLKNGYTVEGEPFIEQTIPHQKMSKRLAE
jgi:ribosomal protein S18 acetylase RimI-like enzyme